MILIYRTAPSDSARELVETLANCRRYRDGSVRPPRNGDKIVCWGESWGGSSEGFEILNGTPIVSKYNAAVALREARVPTVEVSRTRPANSGGGNGPRPKYRPVIVQTTDGLLTETQALSVRQHIDAYLSAPLPQLPSVEWLGRTNNHIGGADLLNPPRTPDYWSKKENLVEEYRIHCFKGKSIRAGRKVQGVEGVASSHQWIRSLEGGWRLSYDGFESTKEMRKLAKDALKALNLDFGAVDIGRKADSNLIVLEVNRAPGLEGNTVNVYANAIQSWVNGEFREETEDRPARRRAA
jgi:hypothetical protein